MTPKLTLKTIIIICLSLLSYKGISQEDNIVNPKDKWFFGAELGTNVITSSQPQPKTNLQGGVLAEYYFAKHWSVSGRIKYFTTGVITQFNDEIGVFKGSVISVPLNLNWEFRISKNFSGNLKLGIAHNKEIRSDYNYPANQSTDYATFYRSFNPGFGFIYFISKNTAIYINHEVFVLGNRKQEKTSALDIIPNSPNNKLFNFGIKYNFNNTK